MSIPSLLGRFCDLETTWRSHKTYPTWYINEDAHMGLQGLRPTSQVQVKSQPQGQQQALHLPV
jgi:hypothetical protein